LGISVVLFPLKEAIPLVTIYYLFNNINKLFQLRTAIDYSVSWPVIGWSMPFALLGSVLMPYAPESVIQKTLGGTILILISHMRTPVRRESWMFKAGASAYGFLSGFVGTGSAVKAMLFSDVGLLKEQFVATMAFTAMFLNLLKIGVYSQVQLLRPHDVPLYGGLFFASVVGVSLGKCLLSRLAARWFLWLVYGVLVATALELLLL
jgi:uncharacterized membrane protein YfcA